MYGSKAIDNYIVKRCGKLARCSQVLFPFPGNTGSLNFDLFVSVWDTVTMFLPVGSGRKPYRLFESLSTNVCVVSHSLSFSISYKQRNLRKQKLHEAEPFRTLLFCDMNEK